VSIIVPLIASASNEASRAQQPNIGVEATLRHTTTTFTLAAGGAGGTVQAPAMVALTAPASNVTPKSLFGMTYLDLTNYPNPPIISTGSLAKAVAVSWDKVQPASACPSSPCKSFTWGQLDNYAASAAAHGVDWFYDFDDVPLWAAADLSMCSRDSCAGTVARISDWGNWVTNLVQRYDGTKGHGRILIYEMWNEPNRPSSWKDTVQNLAILAREAVKIIRANDQAKGIHTFIDTPSGGPSFLKSFMAAYTSLGGSVSDFDAVSFHAYHSSDVCYGLPVPCAEAVLNDIAAMRSAMASVGMSNLPLWNTEGGSGTDSITGAQKAAHVARWYLIHWSAGVSRMMWYAADNREWSTLCAYSPCHPNAAGVAYSQVYSWMVGSSMNVPCAENGTVYTCGLLTPGNVQMQAVWNVAGSSTYTVPPGYAHYRDLAGHTNAISGGSVVIGIQPILLIP
jgi:hypothetical protein